MRWHLKGEVTPKRVPAEEPGAPQKLSHGDHREDRDPARASPWAQPRRAMEFLTGLGPLCCVPLSPPGPVLASSGSGLGHQAPVLEHSRCPINPGGLGGGRGAFGAGAAGC